MANILFYVPFDQRSRDNESLMIAFRKSGHRVICLNQMAGRDIHDVLKANDIQTFSHIISGTTNGFWYLIRHLLFFLPFCKKHKIDIVISHLEPANFVASVGQYFHGAKTVLCRHHIDEGRLYRFDKNLFYYLTYKLAKNIVAVSERAKDYIVKNEGVPAKKVIHINLGYDFSLYRTSGSKQVEEIRSKFQADVLLVTVCRLTSYKRPFLAVEVANVLIKTGLNVKLVILGDGDLRDELNELINSFGIGDRVFMLGHVGNVVDYLAASDFLVHPSVLDSSSVAIKEAGLMRLPPIVCKNIGDFDEFLITGHNGFSVDADDFVNQSVSIIIEYHSRDKDRAQIGENLRTAIFDNFDIEPVFRKWKKLLEI